MWHTWILCWTPSSPSLGLLDTNFVRTNLIRSISLAFVSVRASFSVRWVSASASEVACTNFLVARSTSVACFVSSGTLARLSQIARCFHVLGTPPSRIGCCGCCCCCCCVRQLLFNVTLGAGLGVPESQSLILRSWQFYPIFRIMIAFPICFIMYFFEKQCHQNEVLLLRGRFRMDSEV